MKTLIVTSLKSGSFGLYNYNGLISRHRSIKKAVEKMDNHTQKGKNTTCYEIVRLIKK
jgi:hypothetical protein